MNPNLANESRKYWKAFKWSKEEVQIILDNYKTKSDAEIAELLPEEAKTESKTSVCLLA